MSIHLLPYLLEFSDENPCFDMASLQVCDKFLTLEQRADGGREWEGKVTDASAKKGTPTPHFENKELISNLNH